MDSSRILRLALEITFLHNKYFSHKWLKSYSHKVENLINGGPHKIGGLEGRLLGTQE